MDYWRLLLSDFTLCSTAATLQLFSMRLPWRLVVAEALMDHSTLISFWNS
jgi:hypothetical protein